jgi:hypothetical protein
MKLFSLKFSLLTTFFHFLLHFRYCYHVLKWNIIAITNNHVEANLCLFSPMHNLFQLRTSLHCILHFEMHRRNSQLVD